MPFKVLHLVFVFFGGFACFESAEILTLAGFLVFFSRIKPVFTRLKFAYHG